MQITFSKKERQLACCLVRNFLSPALDTTGQTSAQLETLDAPIVSVIETSNGGTLTVAETTSGGKITFAPITEQIKIAL